MNTNRVAITGVGVITSIGQGVEENWNNLESGVTNIKKISRFDTDGLRTNFAGANSAFDDFDGPREIIEHILEEVISEATSLANQSGFSKLYYSLPNHIFDWDARLTMNTSKSNTPTNYFSKYFLEKTLSKRISKRFEIEDLPVLVSTACASSATAIQMAYEEIISGDAENAIVAAADCSISNETITKFSNLSALSSKCETPECASSPFSLNRDGFVIGEGGACLVLESVESAQKANKTIYGYVSGCGNATDNYHRTKGDPSGLKIKQCMEKALEQSKLEKSSIDYINAHGTSTPENDKMEALAIASVFSGQDTCVTSNKSMIGHTLNSAGVIEAVFSVLSLSRGVIPPTINHDGNTEFEGINIISETTKLPNMQHVMSNSFGFGGQNVSIIFSAAEA